MTKSVTAPLAAVGTAAIKFSSDSQDAFQQFAAATGTASNEMGKYKDMINDVYKDNFGESINDVAEAMATVNQNMSYLDDSALQRCTEYAYTLSDTFGYDVAESTRAANSLIRNFGIEANEAFNLIVQGSQNGLDFSGELLDSINEYAPQFKKMGMSADEMFSVFVNGAQNGAFNLDKIGDAVKENAIRAIDCSDTTAEGFKALGLDATETAKKFAAGGEAADEAFNQVIVGLSAMEDPIERNTAGVNLFGTMWEDLGPEVVMSLSTTNDAIDMTRESMESLANVKYDTLSGALGGLWRTIQVDVLQPIGNQLIPYVTKGINVIGKLTDKWNAMSPATQKSIVKIAGFAAAVGPVLVGIGTLNKGIGKTISNAGALAGAVTKAGGVFKMLASPANIATVAIVAVATAAVLIYKNWDKIKPVIDKAKDGLVNFGQAAGKWIGSVIDWAQEMWKNVKTAFEKFTDATKPAIDAAVEVFNGWYENAEIVIEGIKDFLSGIITFLTGVFQGNWEKAWNGIVQAVGSIFGTLESLVKTPLNAAINLVNKAIGAINKISVDLPSAVGGGHIGFNIPTIPTLAKGTDYWQGGIVQISEKGGEIVDLPTGSRVYPHDESVRIARQDGRKNYSIAIAKLADSIVVREEADIDKIAEAIVKRIEQAIDNMPQTA